MICVNDVDTDCQASANHKYHDQICHGGQTSAVLTSEMKSHWRCDRALHKPIIEIPPGMEQSSNLALTLRKEDTHIFDLCQSDGVYPGHRLRPTSPHSSSFLHIPLKGDPLQGDSGCCCLMPKKASSNNSHYAICVQNKTAGHICCITLPNKCPSEYKVSDLDSNSGLSAQAFHRG